MRKRGWLALGLGLGLAVTGRAVTTNFYYVSPEGSATPPYGSWATAATDLPSAVALASAAFQEGSVDCVVWVTNGTYVLTSSVVIAKGITVRSVNGPDVTIVDGNYPARTNRGFFITGDAVVEGFTITNGYAYPFDDTPARTNVGGGLYLHECQAEIRQVAHTLQSGRRQRRRCAEDRNRYRRDAELSRGREPSGPEGRGCPCRERNFDPGKLHDCGKSGG